jgi:predicted short-subunit dehydrogenase-like oxidoreductase (DUF2520 family)
LITAVDEGTHGMMWSEQRIVVFGAGKAGTALARSMRHVGLQVRLSSSRKLPRTLNADLVVLAVPEAVLPDLVIPTTSALVVHVAGSLPTTVLACARRGVFHPLTSLQKQSIVAAGTVFGIEASSASDRRALFALAKKLRGVPVHIEDSARAKYHAAAAIAGNLSAALLQLGIDELVGIGVDEPVARTGLAHLLLSTAMGAINAPLPTSLTGPVARKSAATLRTHLQALPPATSDLYRRLSLVLVDRVLAASSSDKQRLRDELQRET